MPILSSVLLSYERKASSKKESYKENGYPICMSLLSFFLRPSKVRQISSDLRLRKLVRAHDDVFVCCLFLFVSQLVCLFVVAVVVEGRRMHMRCCWANGSCDDRMLHFVVISIVPPIHPPIHSSVLRASLSSKLQSKRQLKTAGGDKVIHGIFNLSLRIVNCFSLQANDDANKQTNKQKR